VKPADALQALDVATRAIAGELQLDRVLQLIVDGVRELVGARYAALGTVDARGTFEAFITSGMSDAVRSEIGPLPRGHGLLGTIIRDGVTLRIPDISRHPESYGFPPHHPPMHSLLGVPVRVAGETIGNLYLTDKRNGSEFTEQDQELVEMFAVHAGIAIHNARLHRKVQDLAVVDERLRISRDLHDGIIQSIYAVGLSLEDVGELIEADPAEAEARVDRAIDRLHTTIGDIRTFIVGLDPGDGQGIAPALARLAGELAADGGPELALDLSGSDTVDANLPPEAAHELLQIAREAISNVARHSRARRASLSLRVEDGEAVLRVDDDGDGFDPSRRLGPGHFGLPNLRARAMALGGRLTIDSGAGLGTRIIVALPMTHQESPT